MAEMMVIEPETKLLRSMAAMLGKAGHQCRTASTVAEGEAILEDQPQQLTILNARLPWKESASFLKVLEARGLPVLFITSDASNAEHLRAMYASECDVLLSPFTGIQLVVAVNQLLHHSERCLTRGTLQMDVEQRRVTKDGKELILTAQEFELLHVLMAEANKPVSREQLLRTAWGYQGMGITRTVDVHIQRLRRKIGASAIETVYRTGYRLKTA